MALERYLKEQFTDAGVTHDVYRRGEGPAVIVIAEVPGITPAVIAFADRVVDLGLTAVLPHLFGTPEGGARNPLNLGRTFAHVCVSREFNLMGLRRQSPVTDWLRALGRHEHERCGGPGIGVIGMCLTGGFGLAMMADDWVLAPVLSQPSLPLPIGRARKRDLGIDDATLARVKQRAADGACVIGMRFSGDVLSPGARFTRLREELGDAFIAVEIDSSLGNPHGNLPIAHSVVTEDLKDRPGHPTRQALDDVLAFYRERLLGAAVPSRA
ncbi:dienelactone hydrolase family protein [Patulibacter medicamentivorans]|jgi:dienelactone hydrolase|uniref:Dienelactone hydrolase family protein n=1 Tax=Patulibacter medicamentivorans TaxID=1097667 RepID=H0E838_9ACTN|nr:dienelactone hydrolase family protein [Patulibacter medicamentivorans]EHN10161.1 dienelactone hydrolase family protein [Patulibacter medicamentivorans]